MKISLSAAVSAAIFLLTPFARSANPVVSNISAAQRAGTQLVDITYDVTADFSKVWVGLNISSDGGTTYSVPAVTLSGAIGNVVSPGAGKVITWNAGADWNNQYTTMMRFKVTANDQFVNIPTGSFQMGDALDGISNAPIRTVTVSAFFMGRNLITQADWDKVRTWGLANGYTDLVAGAGKATNHPVRLITWFDAIKWCNALSEKEGLIPCYSLSGTVYRTTDDNAVVCNWSANGYRLPTEAEWEKAARGGLIGKRFPWGDSISHSNANFLNNGGETYQTDTTGYHPIWGTGGTPYTSPVGSFATNGYGLYDMVGNAWEWCWDWDGPYATGMQTDPRGPVGGSDRVNRGGSWTDSANHCRVAYRSHNIPTSGTHIGLRVVRSSVPVGGIGFAMTSNVVVDTRAKVLLTTTAQHGTVTGAGEYIPGSTATLTATAAPGYAFTAWSDDASGTANPLSLVMDNPKTITANFAPDTNDSDTDGLTNYQEIVEKGTNPSLPDTDGDGAKDGADAFPLDPAETLDTDSDGIGDNADTDDDGDGYSDEDEINTYHTNPKRADSDGDGLTDPAEIGTYRTNPNLGDTDNDGLYDGEEFITYHTNPLVADTDLDGFFDGYEVLTGKSPLDIADKPALVAEARTAIEFTFPSALGKTYRIEDSTNLTTWKVVESGIAGNGSVIQRFYSTRGMPMRYFRVEEDVP